MHARPVSGAHAVLEALEMFRDLDGFISLNNIVCFLALCDGEGVSMKQLAVITRMKAATFSRAIRMLEKPTSSTALAPGLGLVEIVGDAKDGRTRRLFLTPEGVKLRDRINAEVGAVRATQPNMEVTASK
jgi:DNA-binding MarR family transcriptional regulator